MLIGSRRYENFASQFFEISLCCTLFIGMPTTSCDSQLSPPSSPIVKVVKSDESPKKEYIRYETIEQNNCGGTRAISNITRIVDLGSSVSVDVSGEAGIPGIGNVQVGSEVAATYGYSYGKEYTFSRTLTLTAKEGTLVSHKIGYVEYWDTGDVIISVPNKKVSKYPYKFRNSSGS